MAVGIVSYDVYIPRYRLDRRLIRQAVGWVGPYVLPGEKAVANYDEDPVTMAHAAAFSCLSGKRPPEALLFASTTNPLREGEAGAIIGTALGLGPEVRTVDISNSLKGGTQALLIGLDMVKAGVKGVLVCAADMRLGRPGGLLEMFFGDAGACFLLGDTGLLAEFMGHYSLSYEFIDYRRLPEDRFVNAVEERFIREEGYGPFVIEAIEGLFKKYGVSAKDFAKVGYPCLNLAQYQAIARRLGLEPSQLESPLLEQVGEAGCASPLLILALMLDKAKPGDDLLVVGYGNGAQALWFRVTELTEGRGGKVERALKRKRALTSYERYLAFRGILPVEVELLGDVPATQAPLLWRERKTVLGLWGSRCKRCGTPQYPPQKVCVNPDCRAIGEMEEYWFADKPAKLFTYTADNMAETLNPPLIYGFVDFEGGGRFVFELTDCELDEVRIGMPLRMSLRRKFEDRSKGLVGYFWKAVPIFD